MSSLETAGSRYRCVQEVSKKLIPNIPAMEQSVSSALYSRIPEVSYIMLDSDLAMLYNVETKRLNERVKRNSKRFPENYCFQLTEEEYITLKSQIATSNIEAENALMCYASCGSSLVYGIDCGLGICHDFVF